MCLIIICHNQLRPLTKSFRPCKFHIQSESGRPKPLLPSVTQQTRHAVQTRQSHPPQISSFIGDSMASATRPSRRSFVTAHSGIGLMHGRHWCGPNTEAIVHASDSLVLLKLNEQLHPRVRLAPHSVAMLYMHAALTLLDLRRAGSTCRHEEST